MVETKGIKNEKIGSVVSNLDGENHCGRGDAARAAPRLQADRRSKRKKFYAHDEKGEANVGDSGADRRVPPHEQAEALDSWAK